MTMEELRAARERIKMWTRQCDYWRRVSDKLLAKDKGRVDTLDLSVPASVRGDYIRSHHRSVDDQVKARFGEAYMEDAPYSVPVMGLIMRARSTKSLDGIV